MYTRTFRSAMYPSAFGYTRYIGRIRPLTIGGACATRIPASAQAFKNVSLFEEETVTERERRRIKVHEARVSIARALCVARGRVRVPGRREEVPVGVSLSTPAHCCVVSYNVHPRKVQCTKNLGARGVDNGRQTPAAERDLRFFLTVFKGLRSLNFSPFFIMPYYSERRVHR